MAAERTESKLEWARMLGADEAIGFPNIGSGVRDLTAGRGAVQCERYRYAFE